VEVRFLTTAWLEAVEAREWYASRRDLLGIAFFREMERQIQNIADNPMRFPVIYNDVRRAILMKFPYILYFKIENESAIVIACFHSSRNPSKLSGHIKKIN